MRDFTRPLVAFGFCVTFIGAALGFAVGRQLGIDAGTGKLFMVLMRQRLRIACPAAMRIALPEARASSYMPLSLAVTVPPNISVRIPFYLWLALRVLG